MSIGFRIKLPNSIHKKLLCDERKEVVFGMFQNINFHKTLQDFQEVKVSLGHI